jgi:26S proteasome regulatory subunit (ATPase 3-interacting protein)
MDQVLQFLSEQNRPFTVNDIVQGLNQKLPKSQVVSTLNKLVEKNRVIEKNCGKQKIYCVTQKGSLPLKDVSAKVLDLEREGNTLAVKLKDVEKDLEKKSVQLKKLQLLPTREEVLRRKKILEEEIKDVQLKLESFQGKSYEKKDKEKIEKEYGSVLKEYKKRKRLCTEMVEAIFENYPKSKKHLLQEIGIETDDSVGFQIKLEIK